MSLTLAGCVILDENECVYLLHRNKNGLVQWELPGGKVEASESIEYAAIRELREELGVKVNVKKMLGETSFNENNIMHIYTWFLAEVKEGTLSVCEPETFDDLQSFSIEELSSLKLSNNMKKLYESVLAGEVNLHK